MHPTIVFRVNLETLGRPGGMLPNRTETAGNETVSEADCLKRTRTIYLPGLLHQNVMGVPPGGLLRHGDTFTATGTQAVYLKNEYAKGGPDDVLVVVSQS